MYTIRRLNGKPLKGSKGLELTYMGLKPVMAVQKHLRLGGYEVNKKKKRDHHRTLSINSNQSTSKRTTINTNEMERQATKKVHDL